MSGGEPPFLIDGSIGAPAFAALALTFDFSTMQLVLDRGSAPR
jgi:hypothetical protein